MVRHNATGGLGSGERLWQEAKGAIREEGKCSCCYAKFERSWITNPQGVDWEAFYTFGETTYYKEVKPMAEPACCEK